MDRPNTLRLFANATAALAEDRGQKAAWHCALTRQAAYSDADDLPQGDNHAWREVSDRELAQEAEVDALTPPSPSSPTRAIGRRRCAAR
jgi:hypothetical protein